MIGGLVVCALVRPRYSVCGLPELGAVTLIAISIVSESHLWDSSEQDAKMNGSCWRRSGIMDRQSGAERAGQVESRACR